MKQFNRSLTIVLVFFLLWCVRLFKAHGNVGVENFSSSLGRVIGNFVNLSLTGHVSFYLAALAGILAGLAMLLYWVSLGIEIVTKKTGWIGMFWAVLVVFVPLHLFNSVLYPLSATAFPVALWAAELFGLISVVLMVVFVATAVVRSKHVLIQVSVFALLFSVAVVPYSKPTAGNSTIPSAQGTNIIIVGVDALRPSALGFFGAEPSVTPFIDHLLERAKVYEPAYTPVARTHAAWISVLSGKYPLHSGARFNLIEERFIDTASLITWEMKDLGYHTVWALDERRFNSIDKSAGFDAVVGPKTGAADFLITRIADFPPVNLLVNTRIGKLALPYLHLNRGASITYNPYEFNRSVIGALKPGAENFLSVHFCLPHYPFISNMMRRIDPVDQDRPPVYYQYLSMLELVDRQLKDFFDGLEAGGYLDDAIVYVISDHGEGFPGADRKLQDGNPRAKFPVAHFGHGTSVLTAEQFTVLLAKLRFVDGMVAGEAFRNQRLSSLVDIAADIKAQKGIALRNGDGLPLDVNLPDRTVMIESSFSPGSLSASRLDEFDVLQQTAEAYYVNDEGELRLRSELVPALVDAKQRAIVSKDHLLAIFPDERDSSFLIDKLRGIWWPTAASYDLPSSVMASLRDNLCGFFRNDGRFAQHPQCRAE